jgi:hypothetical protein
MKEKTLPLAAQKYKTSKEITLSITDWIIYKGIKS